MLDLLTFTTLYPNAAAPNHGIFVETRLRHLIASGEARSTVLAPVPWFPSTDARFGAWARAAAAPRFETRAGIEVHHPRFLAIPRVGLLVAPGLLALAAGRALAGLRRQGLRVQAIDAHYLYPDGVAAVALGRRFGLPVVLTARGSDVTQFPDHPVARRRILAAVAAASAVITVSDGLRRGLAALGADAGRITVLRNGVDLGLFRPLDRAAARARFRFTAPTLVSVGGLVARKRHALILEALAALPDWHLAIAGEGPERGALLRRIAQLGLEGRARLLGALPHAELPALYSAADLSVLASSREGWANVLLESMACGTPVVASRIPGNDEVITAPEAGRIVAGEGASALAEAVGALAAEAPAREATRRYAEGFSWEATTRGQIEVFGKVISSFSEEKEAKRL